MPVIIAGFGRFGQIVAACCASRVWRSRRSTSARRTSTSCAASATRCITETLRGSTCCAPRAQRRAQILVFAIDDVEASTRTAQLVREQFPKLRIFARARNRQHAFALMDAGVTNIVRETYASSLEMAAKRA